MNFYLMHSKTKGINRFVEERNKAHESINYIFYVSTHDREVTTIVLNDCYL